LPGLDFAGFFLSLELFSSGHVVHERAWVALYAFPRNKQMAAIPNHHHNDTPANLRSRISMINSRGDRDAKPPGLAHQFIALGHLSFAPRRRILQRQSPRRNRGLLILIDLLRLPSNA
jgi:hypothetical protein